MSENIIDLSTHKSPIDKQSEKDEQDFKENIENLIEQLSQKKSEIDGIFCITLNEKEEGYKIWSQFRMNELWKIVGILEEHKQDILLYAKTLDCE